ncbi:MAG: hypothetical protein HY695_31095 [Deltaproteobacteria bacterium]|nr:hypothetical protein [Deltaproteobacteria bacterium]
MLRLRVGFSENLRLEPLIDGAVKPQGIELEFVTASPGELFYRNLEHDEFDVFEMSISEYLMVKATPEPSKWQWSALPVFPRKAFNWLNLCVHVEAGIENAADLKGKRVGVPDYPMTASLWMRIVLKELYGLKASDICWHIGRAKEASHGGVFGLDKNPPAGVSLNWLNENQTLDRMLENGELDAAFWIVPAPRARLGKFPDFDRYGGTRIEGNPRIRRLFPDRGQAIIREYFSKIHVLPVNHVVVVQNRVLKEHPWAALELYRAFQRSKEVAYERARRWASAYLLFEGDDYKRQEAVFGPDPYVFGLAKNRTMLEILIRGSHEEGLIPKPLRVEDLFYRSTLDT